MSTYHYDGSPCPESCTCAVREADRLRTQLHQRSDEEGRPEVRQIDPWRDPVRDADMKQMDALRAQLEAVTRERDERYDCRGGPGTTAPACGGCVTCLHRVIEATERERDEARAFAADREGLALQLDAAREAIQHGIELRQKAEANAARLREALEMANAAAKMNAEERDEARGIISRLGDRDALESLWALLRYERARVAELERVQDAAFRDAHRAEADAARLREALTQVRDAMRATGQEPDGDDDPRRPVASAVWHALASTPSAEPPRAQAEQWLNDGPEEPGGTLAFHAEPTPRDMRVAGDLRDLDLAAVVTEAVKP